MWASRKIVWMAATVVSPATSHVRLAWSSDQTRSGAATSTQNTTLAIEPRLAATMAPTSARDCTRKVSGQD
jgi:hypothetical protein